MQSLLAGTIGAVIAGVILFLILGNPTKLDVLEARIDELNGSVRELSGRLDMYTVLRKEFEQLQEDVGQTKSELTSDIDMLQKDVGDVQSKVSKVAAALPFLGKHPIQGSIGNSEKWSSAWLNLESETNFNEGDTLRLTLGGNASTILVRLLPKGSSPDDPVGILGTYPVPRDGILDVKLPKTYLGVVQISIHGGSNPWGKYPLGVNNGAPMIRKIELIRS